MANTETAQAKVKMTFYITVETAEALRKAVYTSRSKYSHAVESALRDFLGIKNT